MSTDRPWDGATVRNHWAAPTADDDKYSRGVVGVVAGSAAYPGAAALVVSGAARAGAGMVRYVGPRCAREVVWHHRPEAVAHEPASVVDRLPYAQAWVVGSGVAQDAEQDSVIGAVMDSGAPMVVDAGALEAVAMARAASVSAPSPDQVLLTPHTNELIRTLTALGQQVAHADIRADRRGCALTLARRAHATVLLKGSRTLIASPDGTVIALAPATPWLATAGSGDVLAGIAGTALAQGMSAADAGACAAWIHAQAGGIASGGGPLVALDIASAVPQVLAGVLAPDGPA